MKGYYIEIKNNLLEPKHRKNMGSAVWEFMWCLDKITKIDEDGIGWILGGKPIKLQELADEIGIHESHISENLTKLEKAGYINKKRVPYGLILSVNKASKRFHQKANSGISPKAKSHSKKANSPSEKAKSNIRQDNRQDNRQDTGASSFPLEDKLKEMSTDQRHIQIIGIWMKERNLQPKNEKQYQKIIKRHLRPAKRLEGYSNETIRKAIDYVSKIDHIDKPSLETVEKYIDDLIAGNLKGRKPKVYEY